jgi:NADPH-dependent curcumin reductase CurA
MQDLTSGDDPMTTISREVHLIERPEGLPRPEQFRVVERSLDDPVDGEVLVQNLYMSVDPAMRPRLAAQAPLNAPLDGGAIGRVVASRSGDFAEGDYVQHGMGFREYVVSKGRGLNRVEPDGMPLTAYLGVLGGTGLTAYGGLLVTGALKDGENVFVSAAAGAVGSVAVQIAKIKNCYVIGSAGSDEKCAWLTDELGIDVAINYRRGELRKALKAAAPNGIDVYFENVGGAHLDAALPRMNPLGRIPVCGMISAYNNYGSISEPVTMLANMIYARVTMRGFVVYEFNDLRPQFLADMKQWIRGGRLKYRETVLDGIERAPEALIGLFTGMNTGKMLVRLAEG